MNTNDIAKACNRYILILDILNDKNNMKTAVYANYKPTRYEGKGFFEESKHQDTQGYYW